MFESTDRKIDKSSKVRTKHFADFPEWLIKDSSHPKDDVTQHNNTASKIYLNEPK